MTFPFPFFVPAASAAFPVITGRSTHTGTASSAAVALPSGVTSGELLLMFIASHNGANNRPISGAPAGWSTLLLNNTNAGAVRAAAVFWKIADGTETTATVASNGNTNWTGVAYRIAGAGTPEASADNIENSDTYDPPSLSPTGGSKPYLWLTGLFTASTSLTSQPSGFAIEDDVPWNGSTMVASRNEAAASMDPGVWTVSATAQGRSITVAIPPA